ncbi:cupin domain-containing protein [Marinomonas sp.]|nr:cupin domain-containing protein [Marinomonas sp.]MDB4836957.1 cupin domain-containing protein [Marinomonas sp.]
MNFIDLNAQVRRSDAWKSTVLARIGDANIKVMRMDGTSYPDESHDYSEGLLVIDGHLNLIVESKPIIVKSGEMYIVPVGVVHSVASGSLGTLVIFDV